MRLTNRDDLIVFYQLKERTTDYKVSAWATEILARQESAPKGGSFQTPPFPYEDVESDNTTFITTTHLNFVERKLRGFKLNALPVRAGFSAGKPCSLCKTDMEIGDDRFVLDMENRQGIDYVYWICTLCNNTIVNNYELFTTTE